MRPHTPDWRERLFEAVWAAIDELYRLVIEARLFGPAPLALSTGVDVAYTASELHAAVGLIEDPTLFFARQSSRNCLATLAQPPRRSGAR